jgi:molybdopterin-synthase adenylyltransferase
MNRPRIKPEHVPYRITGGRIRLGGGAYGIAAEIADSGGVIWSLLTAMDGSRSPAEIVALVLARHPGQTEDALLATIDSVIEAGYVEDCAGPVPAGLTDRDQQRYARGRAYFRWVDLTPRRSTWDPQARLRDSRAVVIGVGGTGGNAAYALAASGVGHIFCVDRDVVELSNLNRQVLFSESDVGRSKVSAAVQRLRAVNSDIQVDGETAEIGSAADLQRYAGACDVLVLAADKPPQIRVWANRACLAAGTPWVETGYNGPVIGTTVYVPGVSACFECLGLAKTETGRRLGIRPEETARRWAAAGQAVAAPTAGVSGYLAAHAALSVLTGIPPVTPGRVYNVNLMALQEPDALDVIRRPDCPACGTPAPSTPAPSTPAPAARPS